MTSPTAIRSTELFEVFTNIPNSIELVVSWDTGDDFDITFGGVKGALDKCTIQKLSTGIFRFQFHDVFETTPYAYGTPQPVRIDYSKPYKPNSMKIAHLQVSLASYSTDNNSENPQTYYPVVWYWNPEEFPDQVGPTPDAYKNSVIVKIYDSITNSLSAVTTLRGHMIMTLIDTYENIKLIPKGAGNG